MRSVNVFIVAFVAKISLKDVAGSLCWGTEAGTASCFELLTEIDSIVLIKA